MSENESGSESESEGAVQDSAGAASSVNELGAQGTAGGADSLQRKRERQRHLVARSAAVNRLRKAVQNYARVSSDLRANFLVRCPSRSAAQTAIAPGPARERIETELENVKVELADLVEKMVSTVALARTLEAKLDEKNVVRPAVISLAVDAPSTSWQQLSLIDEAPMRYMAHSIERIFLAAYSNADACENRLPLRLENPKRKRRRDAN